ncbi:MAG: sensor histidine kinase, partial [Lachnospiraceae bacterium]|nr:sensor histidine kinase [Lachnospiraceae bacterium]
MKNSFMNGKLAGRLMMGYLFACVVPLILTSIIIYRVAAESMEETSMEFASAFSSQIVTLMDDLIDTYDRLTKSVLVDNDVITSLSEQESVGAIDQMNSQLGVRKIMM